MMNMFKITTVAIAAGFVFASFLGTGSLKTTTAAASEAGPEVTWKLSTWGKRRAFTEGIEALSEYVSKETDGKFIIRIFYGEQLGNVKGNLDSILSGSIEAAQICDSYTPGKIPAHTVLDLPFLPLPNSDIQRKVSEALYDHPILRAEMAKWGAKTFMSAILPQFEFMGRGKSPVTLKDWSGMPVRAPGGLGEAMEILGARSYTTTSAELYQALEGGTIQAASSPYYALGAYGLYQISDWYTTNMLPGTTDCPTIISIKAYEALPAEYKTVLNDAREVAYKALENGYEAANQKYLPLFQQKLKGVTYDESDLEQFRQTAGKPVWDKWVEQYKGEFDSRALLDFLLKTAQSLN